MTLAAILPFGRALVRSDEDRRRRPPVAQAPTIRDRHERKNRAASSLIGFVKISVQPEMQPASRSFVRMCVTLTWTIHIGDAITAAWGVDASVEMRTVAYGRKAPAEAATADVKRNLTVDVFEHRETGGLPVV